MDGIFGGKSFGGTLGGDGRVPGILTRETPVGWLWLDTITCIVGIRGGFPAIEGIGWTYTVDVLAPDPKLGWLPAGAKVRGLNIIFCIGGIWVLIGFLNAAECAATVIGTFPWAVIGWLDNGGLEVAWEWDLGKLDCIFGGVRLGSDAEAVTLKNSLPRTFL